MPKPYDFDNFGLGRVGEYFSNFSNQNVWGKCGKSKNALGLFHFKPKRMGCLTWECGVWKAPKQNAWAKRNSKQNALGLLHLDCHGPVPGAVGPVRFALNCISPMGFV